MNDMKFGQLSLQPFLIKAIEKLGFVKPTPIQERLIPALLKGENAIGQSQTGTGKTHAYLLPVLHNIDPKIGEVQAIITAPTRELAHQIYDELKKVLELGDMDNQITSKLLVGGTDKQRSIEKLKTQPHLVVGTPGRINDLIKEKALLVHTAFAFVIDEADLMLDLGFIEDVDQIAGKLPENVQMLVFSATIPEKLKPFLKKYLQNPKYTHVDPSQTAAKNIQHMLMPLRHRDQSKVVYDVVTTFNPYLALIFANTKKTADEVADFLLAKGLNVGRIHGGLTPRERRKEMKQVQSGEYQYVVATDLASRGIDIQGVSHVVNVEIPKELDFYIHRVGRTARAGFSGVALTLYDEESDLPLIEKLEKQGIAFEHVDLRQKEWVDLGAREKRKVRTKQTNEVEERARRQVKKPKNIKPGYKKKMKAEVDKIVRKQNRRRKP